MDAEGAEETPVEVEVDVEVDVDVEGSPLNAWGANKSTRRRCMSLKKCYQA